MARLLATFNVIAGGASIAGLYATLVTPYDLTWLIALFALTAAFCAYVLFVPGNQVERNVASKLKHYRYPKSGDTVAIQQGEFTIEQNNLLPIPFPHPFAASPAVELIKLGGHREASVSVAAVTPHKFEIESNSLMLSHYRPKYRWVAKGTLLDEVSSPKG